MHIPVAYFPAENTRVFRLVFLDATFNVRRGHPGLAAADHARPDATSLLVTVQDFRHAPVGHAQLSGYDARPHAGRGHLDDLQPYVVGQRPAVDEHATQLVHPALACGHIVTRAR